ncbi:MAG: nuclear transport factor 2 family protein [Gammaproteobacteria bacterium]|nr:nuclear transport factor 2 family protein [Gammaproteobacteria bacterium]
MSRTLTAEINHLLSRYAQSIDRGRLDELASLFSEDGVLQTPAWSACGRQKILERLSGMGETPGRRPRFVRHHVTSFVAESAGEGAASGRAYFLVLTDIGLDHAGIYIDRYTLLGQQWQIASRQVRLDWMAEGSLMKPATE